MKPIINNADYLLDPNLMEFNTPVEIHVSRFGKSEFAIHWLNPIKYQINFDNGLAYKVLLLSNEPVCTVHKEKIKDVIKYHKKYNLILCTDE